MNGSSFDQGWIEAIALLIVDWLTGQDSILGIFSQLNLLKFEKLERWLLFQDTTCMLLSMRRNCLDFALL
jgi:hypothetical protein